jgi:hypothetical protein
MKLQESMTGFYYVGTKRANITKLVSIFKRGYASGNLQQAITTLKQSKHIQPEVICCDARFGFAAIKHWLGLLSNDQRLSHIPVIVDADRMTAIDNDHYILNRTVDDILNLKEWDENSLETKIRFLQDFKMRGVQMEEQQIDGKMIQRHRFAHSLVKKSVEFMGSLRLLMFWQYGKSIND